MHLQKMLNVLIVIFLVINVGLFFYNDYTDRVNYTLSSERRDLVEDILYKNGIVLYNHLPEAYYPMPKLLIRLPKHSDRALEKAFIGETSYRRMTDQENIYSDSPDVDSETLVLKIKTNDNEGMIVYRNEAPDMTLKDRTSTIEAQTLAKDFVDRITLGVGEFEMVDKRSNKNDDAGEFNERYYEFNERYEDQLLFCNEVKVKFAEAGGVFGITEATSIRYEPAYFTEESYDIYPADEVVYRFILYVQDEGLEDVRITNVDIGYWLGPDGFHDLISTEIEPYYRIRLGSGDTFYINAYTNEIMIY